MVIVGGLVYWVKVFMVYFYVEMDVYLFVLLVLVDNYIWLLYDDDGNVLVVDFGESEFVEWVLVEY